MFSMLVGFEVILITKDQTVRVKLKMEGKDSDHSFKKVVLERKRSKILCLEVSGDKHER